MISNTEITMPLFAKQMKQRFFHSLIVIFDVIKQNITTDENLPAV